MTDPNAGQGGGYSQQTAAQAQAQSDSLRTFWSQQMREVQAVGTDPVEFKNHQLPLARIKKIMKSDEDVRMISAEAPVLFARACEMFILELTLRAWAHAEENKRRTLQRNDVAAAITRTDVFDFLVDIVPKEDRPDAGGGAGPVDPAAAAATAAQAAGMWNGAYPGAPGAAVVDPAAMQQYWQQQAVAAAAAGMPPPWAGPGGEGGG